jgi:hypothetical protein
MESLEFSRAGRMRSSIFSGQADQFRESTKNAIGGQRQILRRKVRLQSPQVESFRLRYESRLATGALARRDVGFGVSDHPTVGETQLMFRGRL